MGHIEDRWTVPGPSGRIRGPRWGKGMRWVAVWVDSDGRHGKSCRTKDEANTHLAHITTEQASGLYITPDRGKVTVHEYGESWMAARTDLKPSSASRLRSILRHHIYPRWGEVQLRDVAFEDVQRWVASIPGRTGTRRRVHSALSALLNSAVKARRIPRNEAAGVDFGIQVARAPRFLTLAELERLTEAMPERWRPFAWFLALTGLRVGEASELRVGDVDLGRRRVVVTRSVTLVDGVQTLTTPKSGAGTRDVPLTSRAFEIVSVAITQKGHGDLVFTSDRGVRINPANWRRRVFDPAASAVGLGDVRPHDLRHTAVSLAVKAGASVKAVQRMAGHGSVVVTLDVYAGLFDPDLDAVAVAMDALIAQQTEGKPAA